MPYLLRLQIVNLLTMQVGPSTHRALSNYFDREGGGRMFVRKAGNTRT